MGRDTVRDKMPLGERNDVEPSNSRNETPPGRSEHKHCSSPREKHGRRHHAERESSREHRKHHKSGLNGRHRVGDDQRKVANEIKTEQSRSVSPEETHPRRGRVGDNSGMEESERKHRHIRDDEDKRRKDYRKRDDGNAERDRREESRRRSKERDAKGVHAGKQYNRTPERHGRREQRYSDGRISGKHEFEERKRSMKKDLFLADKKYGLQKRVKGEGDEQAYDRFEQRATAQWGKDEKETEKAKVEKEKPSFEPSGKLAEDTNTYKGVVIKYNEPSDARKPKLRWRLYPFKGDETLPVLYIHRQSAYLIGRDRRIADLPVDHPSCSKQHAVFQYRLVPVDLDDGTTVKRIRPYIIDLGSANGTYLNGERIEPQRFIELREKDVLRFAFSTREFVLLNEKSNDGGASDTEMPKRSPSSSPE
uniref:Smad nuclear interacting protein 1 n=1 Tax=Ascaris suum TaxID=6253 RepID=F1L024_ASCSU